jgi:hypothetical protein
MVFQQHGRFAHGCARNRGGLAIVGHAVDSIHLRHRDRYNRFGERQIYPMESRNAR